MNINIILSNHAPTFQSEYLWGLVLVERFNVNLNSLIMLTFVKPSQSDSTFICFRRNVHIFFFSFYAPFYSTIHTQYETF